MSGRHFIYAFGEWQVDTLRRELTRQGRSVPLFPRCFDALLLLIEHRGELLTKQFLLDALWPHVVVDENSLAKVISDVRRALGEGPRDQGAIVTVPRRGYRFATPIETRPSALSHAAPASPAEIRSLAVLPFSFVNPAPGDEFLGVGLADALIGRLHLKQTRVRPTSSVTRFADATVSPVVAGRDLAVDAVIAGHIRRAAGTVRVSVQLVSMADEAVNWAETFDAAPAGALELEDSIATRVADALTLALSRGEQPPVTRPLVTDARAFEHYIRGRYLVTRRTRDELFAAIRSLEQAIDIDAGFAPAHATLAQAWIQLGLRAAVSQSMRPREVMPKAHAAALRAVALDEQSSDGHATLGQVLFVFEWRREQGMRELERAIELNPNNQNAQHWYAMALGGLGKFDASLERIEQALEIDPLSVAVNGNAGMLLYRAGKHAEAIAKLTHTLSMDPSMVMTRYRLALAYEAMGSYEEAIAQFEAMHPSADDPLAFTGIARTRALMGQRLEARRLLDFIEERARFVYVPAATIADVHVALGETESALDYLELGVEERAIVAMWMRSESHWDSLRSHPRFQALLAKVGP